jgi:hypothetical protein
MDIIGGGDFDISTLLYVSDHHDDVTHMFFVNSKTVVAGRDGIDPTILSPEYFKRYSV